MPTSPKSKNSEIYKTMKSYLFTLGICLTCFLHAKHHARPNVIFVLADDLGIGDVSPTNPDCKIKTPHLQKMADEGITFMDAHSSSAVCTPTRYGVLTGRYNWRSRLARGVLSGTSEHLIPAERATVAHLLKKAGYHTQMIGKWHLGWTGTKRTRVRRNGRILILPNPLRMDPISMDSSITMDIVVLSTCLPMFGWIPEK